MLELSENQRALAQLVPPLGHEQIHEFLRSEKTVKVIATSTTDGSPNVAFVGTCMVLDPEHIVMAHVFLQRSFRNILQTKQMALLVVEPERETYFLRGLRLHCTLMEQCFLGSPRYQELAALYQLREEHGDVFDPFWADASSYLIFRIDEVRPVVGGDYLRWLGQTIGGIVDLGEEPTDTVRMRQRLEALAAQDALKNRFISNISHELRTPLTTILGYLRFIESGKAGEIPPDIERYLRICVQQGERLHSLLERLLLISTIDQDQLLLRLSGVELAAVIRDLMDSAQLRAQQQGVTLGALIEEGLENQQVRADRERLLDLLGNLIENAIKYGSGSQRVVVGLRRARPDELPQGVGEAYVLEVADGGPGVPAEYQELVFRRFYRTPEAERLTASSPGLGLAICAELAHLHGGELSLTSPIPHPDRNRFEPLGSGAGALFSLVLPVDGPPASEPSEVSAH